MQKSRIELYLKTRHVTCHDLSIICKTQITYQPGHHWDDTFHTVGNQETFRIQQQPGQHVPHGTSHTLGSRNRSSFNINPTFLLVLFPTTMKEDPSSKPKLNRRLIYECRCDGRLKTEPEGSTTAKGKVSEIVF